MDQSMAQEPIGDDVDIFELFGASWEIYRRNAFALSGATLVILALESVMTSFYWAGLILAGPMVMGLFVMALNAVRGRELYFGDAFRGFDYFVQAVFLNVAIFLISLPAVTLCFVPMLVLFVMFLPAYFFLIDGKTSLRASLGETKSMLMQNKMGWALIGIYVLALVGLGFALAGIGLLLTLPIAVISLAYAYDHHKRGWPLTHESYEETAS